MSPLAPRTQRLTVVLLAASLALVGPGLAGLGASLLLSLALGVAAGVLLAARDRLAALGRWHGLDVGTYLRDLWAGPLVGAAVVLAAPGATPAEVQALGGLCGLFGMLNYFLRPIYATLFGLGRYLRRTLG